MPTIAYVNVKSAAECTLAGVTVTFDRVNDALKCVYLRDAKGNTFRIQTAYGGELQAQIPAPPRMEERHIVRAELPVLGKIEKSFDNTHEANDARRELEALASGDVTVSCEKVEVKEESPTAADIPF